MNNSGILWSRCCSRIKQEIGIILFRFMVLLVVIGINFRLEKESSLTLLEVILNSVSKNSPSVYVPLILGFLLILVLLLCMCQNWRNKMIIGIADAVLAFLVSISLIYFTLFFSILFVLILYPNEMLNNISRNEICLLILNIIFAFVLNLLFSIISRAALDKLKK